MNKSVNTFKKIYFKLATQSYKEKSFQVHIVKLTEMYSTKIDYYHELI